MIRIARSASRRLATTGKCYYCLCYIIRKPLLKESDWLKLSKQLLGLQENVFKCLEQNICYKVKHPIIYSIYCSLLNL